MRSTGTYSTWLTPSSLARAASAPVRLNYLEEHYPEEHYLEEQVRRSGWARPGAVLAQRYVLEAPLAARTPSTLWQARRLHPEPLPPEPAEALVTLQLLDPALLDDSSLLAAFFEEAHTAASIEHPHVARLLDYGVDRGLDPGVPFLVLERLSGETLADRLLAQPRLSPQEMARLIGEAARGLEALHGRGWLHRRLNPEHLFLSDQGPASRTQLLFGIDEVLGDNLWLVRKLSHQLAGLGSCGLQPRLETAEYQSPEQLLGHDPIDERSDLWSLAVIAFEAATGMPAFSGPSLGDRLVQICSGEPNLAPTDVPLPAGFASWFQTGVRKRPAERFSSARQMADALHGMLHPL